MGRCAFCNIPTLRKNGPGGRYFRKRNVESVLDEVEIVYKQLKAQSKKYVRDAQIRQILKPIKEQLESDGGEKGIENKLYKIIQHQNRDRIPGYTVGNILNFLIYLKSDLTGKDFSSLSIWQAYLQDVELHNVNFSNSDFSRCVFADTFGNNFLTEELYLFI